MWEELAFKYLKSNGCQWQPSRVHTPERAERLWLVMALAYAWAVSLGTQVPGKSSLPEQLSRRQHNRLRGCRQYREVVVNCWKQGEGGR